MYEDIVTDIIYQLVVCARDTYKYSKLKRNELSRTDVLQYNTRTPSRVYTLMYPCTTRGVHVDRRRQTPSSTIQTTAGGWMT